MQPVQQRVQGKVVTANGRSALLLRDLQPAAEAPDLLYLRYAFVLMGPEAHVFPAFVLDDWGNEIRGLKLYRWVRENGNEFPRATIFGFEADGSDTQIFAREIELYFKLPCFVAAASDAPVTAQTRLHAVMLPTAGVTTPEKIKRPSPMKRPLRSASVDWWQIPPNADMDFPF